MDPDTFDVDALLDAVNCFRQGGQSAVAVLVGAGVDNVDDDQLLAAVRAALARRPDLIGVWQAWSWDKRWSPSPYLNVLEVGHYDGGYRHVRRHATSADACADFVLTEVRWIVETRVVTAP